MKQLFIRCVITLAVGMWLSVSSSPLQAQGQASFLRWVAVSETGANLRILGKYNSNLYFLVDSATESRDLWRTDGTSAGTVKVREIIGAGTTFDAKAGYDRLCQESAVASFGLVFAIAKKSGTPQRCELWQTSGSANNTTKITDIDGSLNLSAAGTGVVFTNYTNSGWDSLVSYDGFKITVLKSNWINIAIVALGDKALILAEDGLWRTDGTASGTVLLKQISSLSGYHSSEMINYGEGVGFTIFHPAPNGASIGNYFELYTSDGTSAGTRLQYTFTTSYGQPSAHSCRIGNSLAITIPGTDVSIYKFTNASGVSLLKTFASDAPSKADTYLYPTLTTEKYCLADDLFNKTYIISSQEVKVVAGAYPLWDSRGPFSHYVTFHDNVYAPWMRYEDQWDINVRQPNSLFNDSFLSIPKPYIPIAQGLVDSTFISFEEIKGTMQVRAIAADLCPTNPAKVAPGKCGCDTIDQDPDGDGYASCVDSCPNDPKKFTANQCGCGIPDTDSDNDGVADCNDSCPKDIAKIATGVCGCGVSDVDNDMDGFADCVDSCPLDPKKKSAGACGCGIADTDIDGDGTPDCKDLCIDDPLKSAPGTCGCGINDVDSDSDGIANCNDRCPLDPAKSAPGIKGCGNKEEEITPIEPPLPTPPPARPVDPIDLCANNANKLLPGVCGCDELDIDANLNGIFDCKDPNPRVAPTSPKITVKGKSATIEMASFAKVSYELRLRAAKKLVTLTSATPQAVAKKLSAGTWTVSYRIHVPGAQTVTTPFSRGVRVRIRK